MQANMGIRRWIVVLGFVATVASAPADRIAAETPFYDSSQIGVTDYLWLRRTTGTLITDSNGPGLNIAFPDFQSAIGRRVTTPLDWSQYDYIMLKVTNTDATRYVRTNLVIQTSSDPNNYTNSFNTQFTVDANSTRTMIFPLKVIDPRTYGLRRLPPVIDSQTFDTIGTGNRNYNLDTVYHWRLSYQETFPTNMVVRDFRLLKYDDNLNAFADQFGQLNERTWNSKISSNGDFAARLLEEAEELAQNPANNEHFGTRRVRPEATSPRWRLAKRGAKWFMVHPNGRLFWSMGLNGTTDINSTITQGREPWFSSLPDEAGPNGDLYEMRDTHLGLRKTFSFYKQNLRAKYGTDYMNPWANRTKARLRSWGLNTIGSWSHPVFFDNSMPFTMQTDSADFPTRLVTPYVHFNNLPDPWASNFQSFMRDKLQEVMGTHLWKRNLMGVMVDNELSFGWDTDNQKRYNIALGALTGGATQPAKIELRRQLTAKYGTVAALNAAWGTSFASWEIFLSGSFTPGSYPAAMQTDMKAFCRSYASAYFGKIRNALNQIGFKGLYLGSRFYPRTTEIVQGAAKYVDVFTVNMYGTANQIDWAYLNSLPKPALLSEFSFGLQAEGSLGGPAETNSKAQRSTVLTTFIETALQQANLVGTHWFEYVDHMVTGRFSDSENYGIGFVDIADNPHQEVVDAFRSTTSDMYRYRLSH